MNTLELELVELKTRLERLEAMVRSLVGGKGEIALSLDETLSAEQLQTRLKAEGLIREPTLEEQHLADEWDDLPEEEKEAHIQFMHSLVLDPPLSQIIIENRR